MTNFYDKSFETDIEFKQRFTRLKLLDSPNYNERVFEMDDFNNFNLSELGLNPNSKEFVPKNSPSSLSSSTSASVSPFSLTTPPQNPKFLSPITSSLNPQKPRFLSPFSQFYKKNIQDIELTPNPLLLSPKHFEITKENLIENVFEYDYLINYIKTVVNWEKQNIQISKKNKIGFEFSFEELKLKSENDINKLKTIIYKLFEAINNKQKTNNVVTYIFYFNGKKIKKEVRYNQFMLNMGPPVIFIMGNIKTILENGQYVIIKKSRFHLENIEGHSSNNLLLNMCYM